MHLRPPKSDNLRTTNGQPAEVAFPDLCDLRQHRPETADHPPIRATSRSHDAGDATKRVRVARSEAAWTRRYPDPGEVMFQPGAG